MVRQLPKSNEIRQIAYIEPDQVITIPEDFARVGTKDFPEGRRRQARDVQANAPWGLARISHRAKGATDYVFDRTSNTYVYVLDTGVKISHSKFEGRASYGYNAVGGTSDDESGHGTHVAGTASSQTYGVARFANIISVKVMGKDGSGTSMSILTAACFVSFVDQKLTVRSLGSHLRHKLGGARHAKSRPRR